MKFRSSYFSAIAVVAILLVGSALPLLVGLGSTGLHAQHQQPVKCSDLKSLPLYGRLSVEAPAIEKTAYGKVYSAWAMANGTFYVGVTNEADGKTYGYIYNTGDLKAESMVKLIVMAQEKQLRVGAYADKPNSDYLGGFCVFNP